jgi:hypothetical protein
MLARHRTGLIEIDLVDVVAVDQVHERADHRDHVKREFMQLEPRHRGGRRAPEPPCRLMGLNIAPAHSTVLSRNSISGAVGEMLNSGDIQLAWASTKH